MAIWIVSGQWAFPFPLDDSYIHLSVARNLPETGAFTVDPSRTDFSSSSPLYSGVLALLFWITGPSLWWSLALGIFGGILLFWYLHQSVPHTVWLWGMILLTPVPLLMMMGMEHIWHLLLAFVWINHILDTKENYLDPILLMLTMALASIRYEGLFLIAAAALIWICRRKWKAALILLGAGILPAMGVGLWSRLMGGSWLPLSLLVKGNKPVGPSNNLLSWGESVLTQLYEHPYILIVLSISSIVLWTSKNLPKRLRQRAFMLQVSAWFHVLLASLGGYRYDAWIILLHLHLLYQWLQSQEISPTWRHALAGFWLALPLLIRAAFFTVQYPVFVKNIYQQSVQAASFILESGHTSVAMHDIGAASWISEAHITDLAMIGDEEVYRLYQAGELHASTVSGILEKREVSLIVIQPQWAGHLLPEAWKPVGTWTIPDAIIVPFADVSFYVRDSLSERVKQELAAYSKRLPAEVLESGPYQEK